MTVSNNDVVQAIVDFTTTDGYHMQNKYAWLASFASDQTDAAVLAAIISWVGDLYDELDTEIPSSLEDPDVSVDLVEWVTDHWEVAARIGEGIAGTTPTNVSEFLPLTVTAFFVGRTARPRSRGRKFMPVFGENTQAGGGLIASAQTAMGAALTEYLADIVISAGNDLIPGVPSTVTGAFLPFLNGFINGVLGTQRKRRQGYGI